MKKRILSLAAALLILFCSCAWAQEDAPTSVQVAERVCPAVVRVIGMRETWSREAGAGTAETYSGSGVYIDEGCVLTLLHVLTDAEWAEIQLADGTRIRAAEILSDEDTDLALLRLSEPLPVEPVPLGDSDLLRLGDPLLAMEVPRVGDLCLFDTVTAGIVSGLNRAEVGAGFFGRKLPLIQADVITLDGQAGGALVNARGELVGIPTFKLVSGEWGPCFAIPSSVIEPVVSSLLAHGKVKRPRMGVMVSELDGPEKAVPGVCPPAGLLVEEVEPGSPAERAGIKPYDVITHAQNKRIYTHAELTEIMDALSEGEALRLIVCRCVDTDAGEWLSSPIVKKINLVPEYLD